MSLFVNNLISLLVSQQETYSQAVSTHTKASLDAQIANTLKAATGKSEVWTLVGGRVDLSDLKPVSLKVLTLREPLPGHYVLQVFRQDDPNRWFTLALGANVFPSEAAALEFAKIMNAMAASDDRQDDIVELLKGADQDDLDELLNTLQLCRVAAETPALTSDERQELEALRRFRDSKAPWPEHATADIRADPNDQGWGRLVDGVLYPLTPATPEREPLDRSVWRVARAIPKDFIRVNGEPCPVPPDTVVYYLHSAFKPSERPMRSRAGDLFWPRTGAPDDIIAYRIAPEAETTIDLTGTTSQQEVQDFAKAYTDQLKNDNL